MKISKILAGVSAMAVMATMVITASAKTTFTITDLQDPEWTNCFPKWTDGTTQMDDYIDAKSFKRDTPMEVTVIYDWTQDGVDNGYVNVKPVSAAKGWNPLGGTVKKSLGYLAPLPIIEVDCENANKGYTMKDTGETINFCLQKDGTLVSNNPDSNEMTFTVTAEGVNALIDSANATSTAYDGILIQTSSAQVKSIVVSQDGVTVASTTSGVKNPGIETTDDSGEPVDPDESTTDESTTDESTTDESTTDESTTDESVTDDSATDSDTPSDSTADSAKKDDTSKGGKSDTTKTTTTTTTTSSSNDASPNTGAAAAAVAGIVLAGAAIVISKKR